MRSRAPARFRQCDRMPARTTSPCSTTYSRMSVEPLNDASKKIAVADQGQPCSRSQRSVSRCPLSAALRHASLSHSQPVLSKCSHIAIWLAPAAAVSTSALISMPGCSRSHSTVSMLPLAAA
eukprot:19993-Heterococcus_DN1.PRE.2